MINFGFWILSRPAGIRLRLPRLDGQTRGCHGIRRGARGVESDSALIAAADAVPSGAHAHANVRRGGTASAA